MVSRWGVQGVCRSVRGGRGACDGIEVGAWLASGYGRVGGGHMGGVLGCVVERHQGASWSVSGHFGRPAGALWGDICLRSGELYCYYKYYYFYYTISYYYYYYYYCHYHY